MAQFSAAAAYNITYAPYVSDYSRYLPREHDQPLDHRLGVLRRRPARAIWLIALGAWLAVSLGADDGLVGLMTAGNNVIDGLGDLAAFFSAAALAATMGMNAYGGALTVLTAVDSVHPINPTRRLRVLTILGLAVVWFVIAKSISASRGLDRLHLADADALPARAVDRDQPGRLLLRPPRPLRDHRPVQGRRDLRRLGPARPDRLRRRLPGRDPVHGPARPRRLVLHRLHGQGAQRRRHRVDRRPDRLRRRLLVPHALAGRREREARRGDLSRRELVAVS